MVNARNQMSFIQEQTPVGDGGTPASPPEHRLFGIDDAIIIPALVGLAGSIFGALWSNKKADDRAEQANNWSLQQWKRENEYNNPTNQMARLAAAGINPALAYSNGVNNSSATSPSVTSAVGTEKNPLAGIDPLTASQVALNDAQTRNLDSKTNETNTLLPFNVQNLKENNNKIAAEVRKLSAEQQDIYVQWSFEASRLKISRDTADAQIKLWNEQAGLAEQDKLKTAEEYRQLQALYALKREGIELTNKEISARIDCTMAQAETYRRQLALIDSQVDLNYSSSYAAVSGATVAEHREGRESAMAQFTAEMLQSQAALQQAQSEYWEDYVAHPHRFQKGTIGFPRPFKK